MTNVKLLGTYSAIASFYAEETNSPNIASSFFSSPLPPAVLCFRLGKQIDPALKG